MKRLVAAFVASAVVLPAIAAAAEGMWTLDHPPTAAMRAELGWAPDARWLDHAMRSAAKFGAGCSSSFVSASGLVLTNHHCAATCIGQLSTPTNDLMHTGFLARREDEERRCPALEVDRLERITDVTDDLQAATRGVPASAFKDAQNAVKARLGSACAAGDARYRCDVVDLYHGGQFKLYRYRRFRDVRLVFAPERTIAFFGGDPDNFNFPRFDLDMAIVRVYEDGKPARIDDFLTIDPRGPVDGEPVFVVGHPGATQRELTVAQLAYARDRALVDQLVRTAEYRGVLLEYRERGAEAMRVGSNELFGVENRYKVLRGRLDTLLDDRVFERKRAEEARLRDYVVAHPELGIDPRIWDRIAGAMSDGRLLDRPRAQLEEGRAFESTYFTIARTLVRGAAERAKPDPERLPEFNESRLPQVEARLLSNAPIDPALETVKLSFSLVKFREVLGADSPYVRRVLGRTAPEAMAADLVSHTLLDDVAVRRRLWEGGAAAVAASDDPFVRLALAVDPDARAIRADWERRVDAVVAENSALVAKARFAMAGDTVAPDATGTLRLSYGIVAGWDEAGRRVAPFTTFGGAYERATGAAPFALPDSWLAARGTLDASVPLDAATTNDTIGGNSGSPVLNRDGRLVGLLFDGNIHSLGGAYWYDAALNRSVVVDSAAILAALERIYGAQALAAELRAR